MSQTLLSCYPSYPSYQSIEKWKLNMKQLPNPKRMKFLICQFCQVQIIKDWLQKHTFVMRVESTFMQSVLLSTFNWLLILNNAYGEIKDCINARSYLNPSCSPNATVFHWFTCSDCGVFRTQTKSFLILT